MKKSKNEPIIICGNLNPEMYILDQLKLQASALEKLAKKLVTAYSGPRNIDNQVN